MVVQRFIFGIDQILRVGSSGDKVFWSYIEFLVMGIGLILVLVPIMIHSWAGQYRIDFN